MKRLLRESFFLGIITLKNIRCGLIDGGLGFNCSFSDGARGDDSGLSIEYKPSRSLIVFSQTLYISSTIYRNKF